MTTQVDRSGWSAAAPQKPPITQVGVLGWLHQNLFSSVGNSLLTVVTLLLLGWALNGIAQWLLGAFWAPVWENRKLFAAGPYPNEALGQPQALLLLLALLFGLSAGRWGSLLRDVGIGLAALLAVLTLLPLGMETQLRMGIALLLLLGGYVAGLRLPFPNETFDGVVSGF